MMPLRPPFAEFPVLTTARLRLRAITPADVPALLPISFFQGKQAQTLEEAHEMHVSIRQLYEMGDLVQWGFELADDNPAIPWEHRAPARRRYGSARADHPAAPLVGTGGFFRGFPHDVGEVGYVLQPAFRGQGFATEATRAMCEFGLTRMGLRYVSAYTAPTNEASVAVLRRAGFLEVPFPKGERPDESRKFVLSGKM